MLTELRCLYVICVSVFMIKRAARASGLLMVKILNKCTLSSLVSDLFSDRKTWNSARRPNPATRIMHVYKGVERKKFTWTISCVNCATVSLLKTLAISLEENFKLMTTFFRCLHNVLPAMSKAVQRDADDTLTIYIPNRVKMVVLYGKTVVKLHLIFRMMNCGLLKLNIYSRYSCALGVLKNQYLMYYV